MTTAEGRSAGRTEAGEGAPAPDGVLYRWLQMQANRAETADEGANDNARHARPPPSAPSLERVIAAALARAAGQGGLRVLVEQIDIRGLSLAELIETLPEGGLITLIEGACEALGVVALCPVTLSTLVEMEAIGRLRIDAPAPRRPTPTDATIAAAFINQTLEEISLGAARLPDGSLWGGYRYASYLDDPRPLALMLDEVGFHSVSLRLRMGKESARTGSILIALPGLEAQTPEATGAPTAAGKPPPAAPVRMSSPRPALPVATAPIMLRAILSRRHVTLRELRAMVPGTVLALPGSALAQVRLETALGQSLGGGRLGESDGCFAVCLDDPRRRRGTEGESEAAGATNPPAAAFADNDGAACLPEPPIADLTEPDAFRSAGLDEETPAATTAAHAASIKRPEAAHDTTTDAALPATMPR